MGKATKPAIFRKKKGKNGPFTGNYLTKVNRTMVNLGTKDPTLAEARAIEAAHGKREFKSDADTVVEAMQQLPPAPPAIGDGKQTSDPPPELEPAKGSMLPNQPAAAAPAPAPPTLQLVPAPSSSAAEEAAGTAAAAEEAAAGNAGDDQAPPPIDPEANPDELAALAVEAQVWAAAEYARFKVFRGFQTPEIAEQSKKPLVEQWKKILAYSGAAMMLPPWVTGLLIPGAILLTSTLGMARAFVEIAKEQKATAGAGAEQQPTTAAA